MHETDKYRQLDWLFFSIRRRSLRKPYSYDFIDIFFYFLFPSDEIPFFIVLWSTYNEW